jgi:hypothetical protein
MPGLQGGEPTVWRRRPPEHPPGDMDARDLSGAMATRTIVSNGDRAAPVNYDTHTDSSVVFVMRADGTGVRRLTDTLPFGLRSEQIDGQLVATLHGTGRREPRQDRLVRNARTTGARRYGRSRYHVPLVCARVPDQNLHQALFAGQGEKLQIACHRARLLGHYATGGRGEGGAQLVVHHYRPQVPSI